MNYNYQDAKMESQQEYFGIVHTDNTNPKAELIEQHITDKELAKTRSAEFTDERGIGYFSYYVGFLAGLKEGRPKWHKLSEKYPDADKLVRVRLMSGMEHICETCFYEPTEDEIGYGKLVINFYELNGEWVDDNDIIAWCEVPKYMEE